MGEKFDALDDRQKAAVAGMVGDQYMRDAFEKQDFLPEGMTEAQKQAHLRQYVEEGTERVAGNPALVAKAVQGLESLEESEVALQQLSPTLRRGGSGSRSRGR